MSKTRYVTIDITPLKYKSYEYFTRDMAEQRKEYRDAYLKALRESGISGDIPEDEQTEIFKELNELADKVLDLDHKARQTYIDAVMDKPERIYDDAMDMLKQIDIDYLVCDALMIWNYAPLTQKGRAAEAGKVKASKNKIEVLRQHFIMTLYNSICYEQVEALEDAEAIFAEPFYKFFEDLLEQAGGEDGLTNLINSYNLTPYDALIYNVNFCSDMDDIFGSMLTGVEVKYPLSEYIKQIRGTDDTEAAGDKKTPIKKEPYLIPALIKSERYSIVNNKVANSYKAIQDSIFKIEANGQLTILPDTATVLVGKTGQKKKIEVYSIVSLDYIGKETGKSAKMMPYDEVVANTVYSMWLNGNSIITISSIFKTMNGNTDIEPKKAQRERIKKALAKANDHIITIDYKNEVENEFIDENELATAADIKELNMSSRLINFEPFSVVLKNGHKVEAIHILKQPPLLTYSLIKKNKQIITIPAGMLNITDLNITDDIVVLKEYLAKQAKLIVSGKPKRNPKILIDTIYEECGIEPKTDKVLAKRFRDTITSIFDDWTKKGYLNGYRVSKKGKSIDGYILSVNAVALKDISDIEEG